MSDLIVIAFPDDATAFEARAEFVKLQKDYLIEMEDVVVVTRSGDGQVQLHQAVNMTAAGAVGGTLWGTLVGLLFLNPLLGAAVGAGAGALSGAVTDLGIDDGFLREVGRSLDQGGAALAVLVHKMTADKVLDRLDALRARGRVLQTSLPSDVEARLRAHFEGPAVGVGLGVAATAPQAASGGSPGTAPGAAGRDATEAGPGAHAPALAGAPAGAPASASATPPGQPGANVAP